MRRALFLSLMACLALLVAAGLAGSLAQSTPAASKAITPSPIYTAAQLGAPAGDDWLMHMGNLKGHRYSSLTQISKANVGTLKLAWKINLGYCTTKNAACGSLEANAVVANGVQYIQDPFGAVYALDGATGARLWKWTPTYEAGLRRRLRLAESRASRSARARSSPGSPTASSTASTRRTAPSSGRRK